MHVLTYFQLRILFINTVVPMYNDQVGVLLEMVTSLSSLYLLIQYLNKIRQRELNPGIKDFDEKIQIIANLTFSLVIALFEPEDLNFQQRSFPHWPRSCSCGVVAKLTAAAAEYPSWSHWQPSFGRWLLKRWQKHRFVCVLLRSDRLSGRVCSSCTTNR